MPQRKRTRSHLSTLLNIPLETRQHLPVYSAVTLKNIILIAGGYDKNLDYTPLAKPILENCKALVLLGQTSAKIEKAVNAELKKTKQEFPIYKCQSLNQAVQMANKISIKGDIVLFSPASTSFDMFKDMYDRGDQFREEVNKF